MDVLTVAPLAIKCTADNHDATATLLLPSPKPITTSAYVCLLYAPVGNTANCAWSVNVC